MKEILTAAALAAVGETLNGAERALDEIEKAVPAEDVVPCLREWIRRMRADGMASIRQELGEES